ncbi:hypothetical protein MNEG_16549 [Monoraphidium neglectum]|jgi:hypothetical protein|uniref:Uncharacterized protein n=1 Tax=Monoraphidium neglectum TaxID=145388 RepID=A0A0D2M7E9_9CHLO|nr:hypothetical protein MNEG_16549 [Monoraphidium neglectum]KIY91415.1 hypothetical protein MNEG_16549 [Monoraphidium neglectum]|eukprot:XP_013890435.1 hypothetical protein MNEG_16549 [Monoraphidium neglectum]
MRAVLLLILINNIFKLPCAFSDPELLRLAPHSGSNSTREAAARADDHRREDLAAPAPQQPRGRPRAAAASESAATDAVASKRSAAGHAGSTHGPTLAQPSALLPLSNATLFKDRQLQRLADRWRLTRAQAVQIGQPEAEGKLRICISSFTPEVGGGD